MCLSGKKGVLGMLIEDHRKVQKLFKDYKSAKDSAVKLRIVQSTCASLSAHTEIEEQHFYPFLRTADQNVFGSLLDEATVEHASAKDLIAQLQNMKPDDALYDARFTVLGEYINHHVKEEEDELFPKVISKDINLRELTTLMEQAKEKLMSRT